jgi:hypothetical protein
MKTNRPVLRKCATMLALIVSDAFLLEACAKEPADELTGRIIMTTKDAKVQFGVAGTGYIIIDWGDGKKSNLNDTSSFDDLTKKFYFTPVRGYDWNFDYGTPVSWSGNSGHLLTLQIRNVTCNSSSEWHTVNRWLRQQAEDEADCGGTLKMAEKS